MQDAVRDDAWVVCLCADWCGVCRQWRAAFEEAARAHPHWRFAWVDVEDEDEAMGDVDIETFPTVLVARGGQPLFLGPVLPSAAGLGRLVASFEEQPQAFAGDRQAAEGLLERLVRGNVLPRSTM